MVAFEVKGSLIELVQEQEVRFDVAPHCPLEGSIGLRSVEVFEHIGGGHAKCGETGEACGVDNGLCDACLSEPGSSQAEDVSVLLDEATVEKLFDESSVKLGSCGKVEAIEPFDDPEMRTLEASLEAPALTCVELGTKHRQSEVGKRRRLFLGLIEKGGQLVGECRQVEIDRELNELFGGV